MEERLNSNEEIERIMKENIKLVYYVAKRFAIPEREYEEVISIGMIGLMKAAKSFEKSKNIKFSSYAYNCIYNEIAMYFRKLKIYMNDVSLNQPICYDQKGNELTVEELIPSKNIDIVENISNREILEKVLSIILNALETRDRNAILYMISGLKQGEIAKILKLSQVQISRIQRSLSEKIKKYYREGKQYKEVYKMTITENSYQISFYSKDVKNFNKILARLLQNINSIENLPEFEISRNEEENMIKLPAYPEVFSFLAKFIEEIDTYTLTYREKNSDKQKKAERIENAVEKKNKLRYQKRGKRENQVKGKSKEVREYILTLERFSIKELRKHFPDFSSSDINNAVLQLKAKRLITKIERGTYMVKKN